MKITVVCHQCCLDYSKAGGQGSLQPHRSRLTVRNDGIYQAVCPKGHISVVTLLAHRFEVLFEIGANAILDGYYRDAVSSFSASLERFYEYFLHVAVLNRRLPEETWAESWRCVRSQSERQLGAFVYVWLLETGEVPPLVPNKWKQFRNEVIHNGLMPSEEDAEEYGDVIFSLLCAGIHVVNDQLKAGRQRYLSHHPFEVNPQKHPEAFVGALALSTIVTLSEELPESLREGLRRLRITRELERL